MKITDVRLRQVEGTMKYAGNVREERLRMPLDIYPRFKSQDTNDAERGWWPVPLGDDLYKVIQTEVSILATDALKHNIELSMNSSIPDCMIKGDGVMLGVLVRNLVDNALRYTPDGGCVVINLDRGDNGIELVITDTGPGITETQIPFIFERFHRGRETKASGSGLGLSIVKRICDLHDASIKMSSARPEGGLEVKVSFQQE